MKLQSLPEVYTLEKMYLELKWYINTSNAGVIDKMASCCVRYLEIEMGRELALEAIRDERKISLDLCLLKVDYRLSQLAGNVTIGAHSDAVCNVRAIGNLCMQYLRSQE